MTTWFIFDTLTGRILQEFFPKTGAWSVRCNEAEQLDVVIPLTDPDLAGMDWRNLAAPWKSSLAVGEHGRLFGGPILTGMFDGNSFDLQVKAVGLWAYFDHRFVLPPAAARTPLVDPATGLPNESLDMNLSGLDFGTIAKKVVQQACAWPGANLPIIYQPDRVGKRKRTYPAVDCKAVGTVLSQLTESKNGPDIRFQLRQKSPTHFEWVLETGTEDTPRLQSPTTHRWDLGAEDTAGSSLSVHTNTAAMADVAWATGGRSNDTVLVSYASSTRLRDARYPLLETVDSSHSDVTVQATLDGYAKEALRTAYLPAQFWSFQARADMAPHLTEYAVGDLACIHVEGSPYIPDGDYTRRIVALSGDETGQWVTITLGQVYENG